MTRAMSAGLAALALAVASHVGGAQELSDGVSKGGSHAGVVTDLAVGGVVAGAAAALGTLGHGAAPVERVAPHGSLTPAKALQAPEISMSGMTTGMTLLVGSAFLLQGRRRING